MLLRKSLVDRELTLEYLSLPFHAEKNPMMIKTINIKHEGLKINIKSVA